MDRWRPSRLAEADVLYAALVAGLVLTLAPRLFSSQGALQAFGVMWLLGGGLLFASLRQGRILERTATDWFFLSAIAAYTYGVLISVNPRFSLEAATPFFVFALAYAIVRLAPITPQRWVDAAVLSGAALGGLVVFDFALVAVQRWRFVYQISGSLALDGVFASRADGPFGNANIAAIVLVGLFGLALGAGVEAGLRRRRRLLIGATIMVLAIIVTGSRGGLLASGVAVALVVAHVWRRGRAGASLHPMRLAVALGSLVVLAAGLVGRRFLAGPYVRGFIWEATLRVFERRPQGWGPGVVNYMLPSGFGDPSEFSVLITHSHSAYLQALSELGVPGVGFVLVGVVVAGVSMRRAARAGLHISAGPAVGLAALAVHGMVESVQVLTAPMAMAGLLVALLARVPAEAPREGGNRIRMIRTLVCVGVVTAILGLSFARLANWRDVQDAVQLSDVGRWSESATLLASVADREAWQPAYPELVATALGMAGRSDEAEDWIRRAIRVEPREWSRWLLAAQLADARGEKIARDAAVSRALANGAAVEPVGALIVAQLVQSTMASEEVLAVAVRQHPVLLGSAYWSVAGVPDATKWSVALEAAEGGAACRILVAIGGTAIPAPDSAVEALRTHCALQASEGQASETERVAAEFYVAVMRGDRLQAIERASLFDGSPGNSLVRRIMGTAEVWSGQSSEGRRDLAAAAALGDMVAINMLLADATPGQQAALEQRGWATLSAPVLSSGTDAVPIWLTSWLQAVLRSPIPSGGVFMNGPWQSAVDASNIRFLELLAAKPNSK